MKLRAARWVVPALLMLLASTAAFAACVGDDPQPSRSDGGEDAALARPDADAPPDAAEDASDAGADASGSCSPTAVFGAPALLAVINTASGEHGARLTPDELTIYFNSLRAPAKGNDIFVATRATISGAFGVATAVAPLSTVDNEVYPSLSARGELFFSRGPAGPSSGYDIFVATRATPDAGFGSPVAVAAANSGAGELHPFAVPDGDVYFTSLRRVATTGADLFFLPRSADGGFGTAEAIEELNSSVSEGTPVLSFDARTIYFNSIRLDDNGDVAADIWVAHRSAPTGPFQPPRRVPELSVKGKLDFPTWLSPDNCRLYMASDRTGTLQVYVATRQP